MLQKTQSLLVMAGYIVGKGSLIATLRKVPMLRALRVDKVTLAGIEATLRHYLRGDALEQIPVWRAIAASLATLEARARAWQARLDLGDARAGIVASTSTIGGGSLPGLTLPTRALGLVVPSVDRFAADLRAGDPPVVGRIEDGRFLVDPRTVMPDEDDALIATLRTALAQQKPSGGRP